MKVILDVKNMKSTEPIGETSIILYDATDKNWYITSKDTLLKEFYDKSNAAIKLYSEKYLDLENRFNLFQSTFSEQYKQIVELVKILAKEQERK